MRLYGISENEISQTIGLPDKIDTEGNRVVALKQFG